MCCWAVPSWSSETWALAMLATGSCSFVLVMGAWELKVIGLWLQNSRRLVKSDRFVASKKKNHLQILSGKNMDSWKGGFLETVIYNNPVLGMSGSGGRWLAEP